MMIEFNEGKGTNKYLILAHYRKDVPPEDYIVYADNAKQAKQIFNDICTWLTVFSAKEI